MASNYLKAQFLRAAAVRPPEGYGRNLGVDQRAYLAGFIDGEGNINISGGINKNGNQNWALVVTLYNCNLNALETMRDWLGVGSILARKRTSRWRTNYALKWRGISALKVLEAAYPFLIIKKKQAEIAFQFAQTICPGNFTGSSWQSNKRLKPEIVSRRRELKLELQKLTGTANYGGDNSLKAAIN